MRFDKMIRSIFQYISIINLLAGVQGTFLAVELAGRRPGNRPANRLLGLLVFAFSVAILGTVLGATGWYQKFPHLIRVGEPFVLLLGPALFLYIVLLRNGRWHPIMWVHFLPFALYVIYLMPFYSLPGQTKIDMVKNGTLFNEPLIRWLNVLKLGINLVYIAGGMWLIKQHQRWLKNRQADIARQGLQWLYLLSGGLLLLWLVAAIGYLFSWRDLMSGLEANIVIAFVMSIFIYAMGYGGLRQPEISAGTALLPSTKKASFSLWRWLTGFGDEASVDSIPDAELTANQEVRHQELLAALLAIMETQKPYLKSDLSIEELAREAAIPTYLVSKLLNQYLNENFYEFVNRYRVEAVKHRLSDPQYADFTILSIAFDCGFQSKSTFNESFKKVAGCTPSAFRRRALVRNPRK